MTTYTSAPIGSSGQLLDGLSVDTPAGLGLFRETVALADSSSGALVPVDPVVGLYVNVASTVAQAVNVSVVANQITSSIPFYVAQSSAPWTINGGVAVTSAIAGSTQIISSIPFYVSQSTSPWVVNGGISVTNSIAGSTQIISSIPFFVAQSSAPWTMNGGVAISTATAIVSTVVVSSVPHALVGTSQIFGTVSSQIVSSLPLIVSQSTSPWTINGGVSVTSQSAVSSSWPLSTTLVNVVSSLPLFVTQSSAPWSVVLNASSSGGMSVTTIVLLANYNTTVIKNSTGQIYAIDASNIGGTNLYIKLYPLSTAALTIVSTAVANLVFGMNASTSRGQEYTPGVQFNTGISMISQSVGWITTSNILNPAASTGVVTIYFK